MGPLSLNIVDTPGFGDTRGQEFDKKHVKMIVDRVKELGSLHAITIVISGRDSRMTAQLKYVLSEVCAILPKNAKDNLVVVFTNTSSPLYLSFDIEALSKLVDHPVTPNRQVFIENPYVLWERSMQNRGKVDDVSLQTALVTAFKDAGSNLAKFFSSAVAMPILNTAEFERLYSLRQKIEMTTMQILTALENAQEEQKKLAKQKEEIELAKTQQDINREYRKSFQATRWVFKDSDAHGTFCGFKDCHSNCHAPCSLEKTMDNERFKYCKAFNSSSSTQVELHSKRDVKKLLDCFKEVKGNNGVRWLRSSSDFIYADNAFKKRALLYLPDLEKYASKEDLLQLNLPAQVEIESRYRVDHCDACGHHRQFHYHDNKLWEVEEYTEEVVDEQTKARYEAAKGVEAQKKELLEGIQARIDRCEAKQQELGASLMANIQSFEEVAVSRNYAQLLQNQRDLLEQHIDATLEGEPGADVSALKKAMDEIQKKFQVVTRIRCGRGSSSTPWFWLVVSTLLAGGAWQARVSSLKRHT